MSHPKVDAFVKSEKTWKAEVKRLRELCLENGLEEDFKWNLPCYTQEGRNITIIQPFKAFCALMYFDGHRLENKKGLLKKPGANSNIAMRIEFTSSEEIEKDKAEIKRLIKESVKLPPLSQAEKPQKETPIAEEFQQLLKKNPKLRKAFEGLTPGRQRMYLMHFSSAKQEATRLARIEKCTPNILKGLGLSES